jgi:hypothetical protein
MPHIKVKVPADGDYYTDEALAGLVGQTPRLTIDFDHTRPVARLTVTAATRDDDGGLLLTLDFPDWSGFWVCFECGNPGPHDPSGRVPQGGL